MPQVRSDAARTFGERVRAARTEAGITQLELAGLAGVHETNISKLERGESDPKFSSLIRIAAALEVDPADFVRGIGADQLPPDEPVITRSELIRALRDQKRTH